MANEQLDAADLVSGKAGADLSTHQYKPVKITAAGAVPTVGLCTAATDRVFGILQNKPKANEAAELHRGGGIGKVVADGSGTAIAAGDLLGTNAASVAVKKAAVNDLFFGIALEACAAAGLVISFAWEAGQRTT